MISSIVSAIKVSAVAAAAGLFSFMPFHMHGEMPRQEASSTRPMMGMHDNMASSTRPMGDGKLSGASVTCIGTAASTREASLDSAMSTLTGSINAAYATRATALSAAYNSTATSSVRASVNSAWTTFSLSMKSAHDAWNTAQQTAWMGFKAAVKACGPGAVSESDSMNAGVDAGMGADDSSVMPGPSGSGGN